MGRSRIKAWVVEVEDIVLHYKWDGSVKEVTAMVVWHTAHTHSLGKRPYRTRRYGKDELDLYTRFLRDCEYTGYDMGDPPDENP